MNSCKNESSQQQLNNNFEMDKHTTAAGCFSKSLDERQKEDFQSFNEVPAEIEDVDSDENQVNLSDSYDDLPVSDQTDDDDVQLSSPSNSDVEQRWYAFRGRWGIVDNNQNDNNLRLDNQLPDNNQPQQQQDEEETDFLEMDFEPDTNSEIENQATLPLPNGHQHTSNSSNTNSFNFHNPLPLLHLPQPEFRINSFPDLVPVIDELDSFSRTEHKNTGAKPKQPTANRQQKAPKHVSDGDNVFKMCTFNNINNNSIEPVGHSSSIFKSVTNSHEVYNLGASSSREPYTSDRLLHDTHQNYNQDENSFMKIHKSPSKSSSHHHNHKHLRLQEEQEQNDQFLFEIEPIKPRNSVTIYTTNCDEKILLDALSSLDLNPNREMIASYFNRIKPSTSAASATANNCELNLVDYIIYKSKLNCNYLKLIELIQKACKIDDDDSYGDKKFDVNFYPVSQPRFQDPLHDINYISVGSFFNDTRDD